MVNTMNRSTCRTILLFALLGMPALAQAQPLTYPELLARVPETSPQVRAAQARVAQAEGELSKVWSAWKPNLEVGGQVQYSTQEVKLDFGGLLGGLASGLGIDPATLDLPPETVIQPHWSVAGVAKLRQLLFNPSAWHGPAIARAAIQAQTLAAEATTDELKFGAAQVYAALQTLDSLEEAAQRALSAAEGRIRDAQVRVDAGIAAPIDITRAKVRAAEAQNQLAQIQAQRRSLQADLQVIIGAEAPVEVAKGDLPQNLGEQGSGPDDRRDVAARKAALSAAQHEETRTAWLWLPSLFFEAQATATNVGGFAGNHYFGTGTLGLSFPLYDGGARYANRDIAQAKVAEATAAFDEARIQALSIITKAEAKLQEAQARLILAESQLTLANQAVEQVNQLHQSGLATSLDLDDADVQRFAADRQVAERALDVALSRLRLHHARGGRLL